VTGDADQEHAHATTATDANGLIENVTDERGRPVGPLTSVLARAACVEFGHCIEREPTLHRGATLSRQSVLSGSLKRFLPALVKPR
jgi:hypothetical protein